MHGQRMITGDMFAVFPSGNEVTKW